MPAQRTLIIGLLFAAASMVGLAAIGILTVGDGWSRHFDQGVVDGFEVGASRAQTLERIMESGDYDGLYIDRRRTFVGFSEATGTQQIEVFSAEEWDIASNSDPIWYVFKFHQDRVSRITKETHVFGK